MKLEVRNRLRHFEKVVGAKVAVFNAAAPKAILTGVTNASGNVELKFAGVPDGVYVCTVTPKDTSADPVGPGTASAAHAPDRIYRTGSLNLTLRAGAVTDAMSASPSDAGVAKGQNQKFVVNLQPVWMRSPQNGNRSGTVNTVIVHHTAANVNASVATFMSEKGPHYMIDTDGQVVKFVQDTRRSFHAGWSNWMGSPDVNQFSIGIEIINTNEPYAEAQYTSLLDLLRRLMQALRDIDSWNIVGHNDIATHDGSHTGQLGRKSSDPGLRFEWSRLEARQLGMLMAIGPPSPSIYVGLFTSIADLSLREGDNDKTQRFGGKVRTGLTKAAPVKELQQDLRAIGYWVGTPDGDYGGKTVAAVRMLQEHFFAGGRGHKAPDGRVDARTAALIKSVVATSPRAVASPASAGP